MGCIARFSLLLSLLVVGVHSFAPVSFYKGRQLCSKSSSSNVLLHNTVQSVTGEELELMLEEWETPLVVDAYATWCGPCQLMAPEFEAAAEEYKGKVRFVKMDTDKEEIMASRLGIMGLPTILFLDEYKSDEGEAEAKAVLKGRIEGALRKDTIAALCEHYFFDGPTPEMM